MPSPNDNPIFRFKAAWWALAMLLLFAVLAWILRIGFPPPPPTLEELAAADRYAIRAEVDAAQIGKAPSAEVFSRVAKELLSTKPTAVKTEPTATEPAADKEEPAGKTPGTETSQASGVRELAPAQRGIRLAECGGAPGVAGQKALDQTFGVEQALNLRQSVATLAVQRRLCSIGPAVRREVCEKNDTGGTPALLEGAGRRGTGTGGTPALLEPTESQ